VIGGKSVKRLRLANAFVTAQSVRSRRWRLQLIGSDIEIGRSKAFSLNAGCPECDKQKRPARIFQAGRLELTIRFSNYGVLGYKSSLEAGSIQTGGPTLGTKISAGAAPPVGARIVLVAESTFSRDALISA
jgi:hypothetical protein